MRGPTEKPSFSYSEDVLFQRIQRGETWSTTVQLGGFPTPRLTWTLNNAELDLSETRRVINLKENVLEITISDATQADGGLHKICATNEAGFASLDLSLKVVGEFLMLNIAIEYPYVFF
jgi:hypothetical protein